MKKTYTVLLALAVVAGLATSAFGALEPWTEDFSGYYNGQDLASPWNDDSAGGGTRVVVWNNWLLDGNTDPGTGNVLYGGDGNGNDAWRSIGSVSNGTFEVEFDVMIANDYGTRIQDFGIGTYDAANAGFWDDYQVQLRMTTNKLGVVYGTNEWHEIANTVTGQWYNIKLVVSPDMVNGGTYDVYLDGYLVDDGRAFVSQYGREKDPCTDFATTFGSQGTIGAARFFFDDITVAELPQPSIYVDFGETLNVSSPDTNGWYWNEAGSGIVNGGALVNLVDENNGSTSVDLNITGNGFIDDDVYGYDLGGTASSLVPWPTEASGDCWEVVPGYANTVQIADLDTNKYYDVTLYGGRFTGRPPYSNGGRRMDIVENGTSKQVRLMTEGEDVATLRGVQPDASGTINITFTRMTGDVGHLCAMRITEVPEPPPASVYIDFDEDLYTFPGMDSESRFWNKVDKSLEGGGVVSNLVDEYKVPTTIDARITDGFYVEAASYGFEQGSSESGLVDWPAWATGDGFRLYDTVTTAAIRVEGLQAHAPYDLTFYGGRFASRVSGYSDAGRVMDVGIGGTTATLETEYENTGVITNVQADASGQIDITFTKTFGGSAHFCAMQISPLPFAAHSDYDVAIEVISGSQVEISWDSEPGYSYKLQSKSDLVPAGSWTDVDTGITGTGGNVASTQTVSGTEAFYKVSTE
ncbi:MAG: hypothetical protein ABFR33_04465 [Verrucomicrobiota bacterium]